VKKVRGGCGQPRTISVIATATNNVWFLICHDPYRENAMEEIYSTLYLQKQQNSGFLGCDLHGKYRATCFL
jgi:hypothetical protein